MKFALIWVAGATLTTTLWAAEAATPDAPIGDWIAQLLPQLGGLGFVIWFARYLVTTTLPDLSRKYEEGLKRAFDEAKAARDEFREETLRLMAKYDESLSRAFGEAKAARDEFRAELARSFGAHDRCAEENRKTIAELSSVVQEMVANCRQHRNEWQKVSLRERND